MEASFWKRVLLLNNERFCYCPTLFESPSEKESADEQWTFNRSFDGLVSEYPGGFGSIGAKDLDDFKDMTMLR